MLRKRHAATLLMTVFTGAAFGSPPVAPRTDATEKAAKPAEALTLLHTVSQWSTGLSEMADQRAKSELVKDYAREVATANAAKDAKLMGIAKKKGIELGPLDAGTEEGKSLLDRMKAEKDLLGSLEGDAFDKEYMTLVTNTQQSVIQYLEAHKATAKDQDVKQFMGDLTTVVRGRLKKAQDIMAKVYGDKL